MVRGIFFLCRNLPASTHRRKHRCFKLSNEVILKRCHLTQNMPPMGGHTVTHEAILPKTQPESDRSWIFLINLQGTGEQVTGHQAATISKIQVGESNRTSNQVSPTSKSQRRGEIKRKIEGGKILQNKRDVG